MTNDAVQDRLLEHGRLVLDAARITPGLAQAEQVEVIDCESAYQHQRPAEPVRRIERDAQRLVLHGPDDAAHRLPQREQENQREARKQDVGAALGRFGDDARPGALEPGPRHDAVLHGEYDQQQGVHEQGRTERCGGHRINGFWYDQVADEANCIQKRGEKHGITNDAIGQHSDAFHRYILSRFGSKLLI